MKSTTASRKQPISTGLEKSFSRYALATAGLAVASIPAVAKADFSGPYAPANWTFSNTGGSTNGMVDTSGAPASITLTGGSSASGSSGTTNFTIAAVASGTLNFHWSYSSSDSGSYDIGNFLLNGNPTFLASNASQGSGDFSIALTAGDVFGFQVFSADNLFGPGILTISNFSAPVPEPATIALFALGAAGVGLLLRRRKA